MQTNNSEKPLLVAMGTGANNMVIGYLCERLADRVDFLLSLRDLTMREAMLRADKEIEKLLMEIL